LGIANRRLGRLSPGAIVTWGDHRLDKFWIWIMSRCYK